MAYKVPRMLISLLVIELYICLHGSVLFLELVLFVISKKGKKGATKDQVFVDLFAILNYDNLLWKMVDFPSTLFITSAVYSQPSVRQGQKRVIQTA